MTVGHHHSLANMVQRVHVNASRKMVVVGSEVARLDLSQVVIVLELEIHVLYPHGID